MTTISLNTLTNMHMHAPELHESPTLYNSPVTYIIIFVLCTLDVTSVVDGLTLVNVCQLVPVRHTEIARVDRSENCTPLCVSVHDRGRRWSFACSGSTQPVPIIK